MSFRVAAASSDGISIDLHFGHASDFYVYEVQSDGSYEQVKIAHVPKGDEVSDKETALIEKNDSGCGSGGCGRGGGCHSMAALSINTDFLEGSKYVLAAKVGNAMEKALLLKNITAFSIELPIEQAIKKITIYENRLNQFK